MGTQFLIDKFRRFLPDDSIVSDRTSLREYECDGLSAYRQTPKLVVLTSS